MADEIKKQLFALVDSEAFEDACLIWGDRPHKCKRWNKSASYCMSKNPSECRKVNLIVNVIESLGYRLIPPDLPSDVIEGIFREIEKHDDVVAPLDSYRWYQALKARNKEG